MKTRNNFFIILVIFLIMGLTTASAGCIKSVQGYVEKSPEPGASAGFPTAPLPAPEVFTLSVPDIQETLSPSTAKTVDPIYPKEYYRTIRNLTGKTGVNATLPVQDSWSKREPLYTLHYSANYGISAIQVNVTQGPLVIIFKAKPKINDPRISFADMTVRELPSKGVVAEERIDHFSRDDVESTTGTKESGNPNEKHVVIFREGSFHINVYGNQVDADISVYTGDSPVLTGKSRSGGATDPLPEEEERW